MLLRRRILLLLVVIGVAGSISVTAGYGLYLRSDRYRTLIEQEVTDLLQLPIAIDRIQTLTTTSRAFHNISVSLPTHGDEVFHCARAVWHDASRSGQPHYTLDLDSGWLLVGTSQWAAEDYEAMLRSGLGQDFAGLSLRRVQLNNIDLEWRHPDITLTLRDAVGQMVFQDDGTGRASLVSYDLSGYAVDQAIKIIAHFTPGAGLQFHEAELQLPTIPLGGLGLDRLLRTEVSHGHFQGELRYRLAEGRETILLSGEIDGASLEELTEPVIGGPFRGEVNVIVDEATFVDRRIDALRFRGQLSDLHVTDLVPMLHNSTLDPRVQLRVHQASVCGNSVEFLSATGKATDLSLEGLTGLIGRGTLTGRLRVDIRNLQIVDDRLSRAEVDVVAVPPEGAPGLIDRTLLDWVSRELIGLDISSILPEKIEYAQLGARLVIEGETLRIRGSHGKNGRTILTARVWGRDIAILNEFDDTFEVGPLVARLREALEVYDTEQVREWWEELHTAPP